MGEPSFLHPNPRTEVLFFSTSISLAVVRLHASWTAIEPFLVRLPRELPLAQRVIRHGADAASSALGHTLLARTCCLTKSERIRHSPRTVSNRRQSIAVGAAHFICWTSFQPYTSSQPRQSDSSGSH